MDNNRPHRLHLVDQPVDYDRRPRYIDPAQIARIMDRPDPTARPRDSRVDCREPDCPPSGLAAFLAEVAEAPGHHFLFGLFILIGVAVLFVAPIIVMEQVL